MKKLRCHTQIEGLYGDILAVGGTEYQIIAETLECYIIIDECGYEHEFTKESDEEGLSYKNWFDLVDVPRRKPKSKPFEGFFDGLGKIVDIEEKERPTYSDKAFTFKLSDEQTEKAKQWMKEREKYVGAIGGQFTFTFTPTGLGNIVTITDGKEELRLTDSDLW